MDLNTVLTECIEMADVLYDQGASVAFSPTHGDPDGKMQAFVSLDDEDDDSDLIDGLHAAADSVENAVLGLHKKLKAKCAKRGEALAPFTKPR